jgi:deoxyribodipyrimidine photo-lyase
MPALMWFRRDLRLADNPAWSAATRSHDEVVALFVIDPALWRPGSIRTSLLAGHLEALDGALAERGGRLRIEHGDPETVVPHFAGRAGVDAVYLNEDYTPYATRRDAAVEAAVAMERFSGLVIHPPGDVLTAAGTPPKVFTPYHRRWAEEPWGLWPTPGDARIAADAGIGLPDGDTAPLIEPGEAAAQARLAEFMDRVDGYPEERDRPDLDTTSRLSSDLHFGTLDPRRVRHEVGEATAARAAFVRQLAWRDFYLQVMFHNPASLDHELRPDYAGIAWRNDPAELTAWQEGRTGYPIVDAGMRQLLAEGFMHNRVRMIAASFLVKDLLVDWRLGERWFRRRLIDGDVAQNVGNWQWVAGTGADAAPYFRVFNPVSQGKKFDPKGDYVRRYVPELADLSDPGIHAPWDVGPLELAAAGVTLGDNYPEPIVDHAMARERVLDAYAAARNG